MWLAEHRLTEEVWQSVDGEDEPVLSSWWRSSGDMKQGEGDVDLLTFPYNNKSTHKSKGLMC